ncbi:MAG: hypothetical protein ACREKH_05945 [Candidatus Rokuibacteriota bacterium]
MPLASAQAILFTHVGLTYDRARALQGDITERQKFVEAHIPFFRACLECKNIAIVYIYVDAAIRHIRLQKTRSRSATSGWESHFSIPDDAATLEESVVNSLKKARARAVAIVGGQRCSIPGFIFIGVGELVHLFNSLGQIDPVLLRRIAGARGNYTYDSPKFVEAVIRIARGLEPHLAPHPVVRIDEDVLPNEDALGIVLEAVNEKWRSLTKYFFFSGTYRGRADPDSLHEHAVRTHWLTPNSPQVCAFLGDLGEMGAVQIVATPGGVAKPGGCATTATGDVPRSDFGDRQAQQRRSHGVANRPSPQVISGAGLAMSISCILDLPPFLIPNLVVWVDDHLKRRLHEQVGHIAPTETERILEARFLQEREGTLDFARLHYFERLFRGCLMHALIVGDRGGQGPLAGYAELAVKGQLRRASHGAREKLIGHAYRSQVLVDEFGKTADARGAEILDHWRGTKIAYGDGLLAKWAEEQLAAPAKGSAPAWWRIRDSVAGDAFDYLVLVTEWSDYVRAIQRLRYSHAAWLFATPET